MPESLASGGARVHELGAWEDFRELVRREAGGDERLFRGQRRPEWPLASPWERWLAARAEGRADTIETHDGGADAGDPQELRDGFLRRFKEQCLGLPGFDSADLDDHDWWALGRHYGLTTPLLDWSMSPYVAAFFAFLDHADEVNPGFSRGTHHGELRCGEGRVAVWELELTRELRAQPELEIILPRLDRTHRRRAQGGFFTRLSHGALDLRGFLAARGLAHCLTLYAMPVADTWRALRDLYLMDIHPAKLFPDFDGAAAMANLLPRLR